MKLDYKCIKKTFHYSDEGFEVMKMSPLGKSEYFAFIILYPNN